MIIFIFFAYDQTGWKGKKQSDKQMPLFTLGVKV